MSLCDQARTGVERLSQNSTGQVVYELKAPYRDGTTHVVFEPLDFLAKLAALVPRPRANLVRYHGILAPNAKDRDQVIPRCGPHPRRRRGHRHAGQPPLDGSLDHARGADREGLPTGSPPGSPDGSTTGSPDGSPTAPLTWMERLRRVFAIDLSVCPHCGGSPADVTDPHVIQRILRH